MLEEQAYSCHEEDMYFLLVEQTGEQAKTWSSPENVEADPSRPLPVCSPIDETLLGIKPPTQFSFYSLNVIFYKPFGTINLLGRQQFAYISNQEKGYLATLKSFSFFTFQCFCLDNQRT